MGGRGQTKESAPMKNITINIPDIYEQNIQELIKQKLIPSRSEAVRTALREFLHKEYDNLEMLGFFEPKRNGAHGSEPPENNDLGASQIKVPKSPI